MTKTYPKNIHDQRTKKKKKKTKKKQKTKTKNKNKQKKTVKHQCQVASPGGRSLSTEKIIKLILFPLFCNNSPSV